MRLLIRNPLSLCAICLLSVLLGSCGLKVTQGTETKDTATITTNKAHGLNIGDTVTVRGVTPVGYNGTFVVLSVPSPTMFTYLDPALGLGPAPAGGTVEKGGTMHQKAIYYRHRPRDTGAVQHIRPTDTVHMKLMAWWIDKDSVYWLEKDPDCVSDAYATYFTMPAPYGSTELTGPTIFFANGCPNGPTTIVQASTEVATPSLHGKYAFGNGDDGASRTLGASNNADGTTTSVPIRSTPPSVNVTALVPYVTNTTQQSFPLTTITLTNYPHFVGEHVPYEWQCTGTVIGSDGTPQTITITVMSQ